MSLGPLEGQVMETHWNVGEASVQEVHSDCRIKRPIQRF